MHPGENPGWLHPPGASALPTQFAELARGTFQAWAGGWAMGGRDGQAFGPAYELGDGRSEGETQNPCAPAFDGAVRM